jgi:carboxypeptidase PM20D1
MTMRSFFKLLALALMILFGVLLINTYRLPSKQMTGVKPTQSLSIADTVVEHLAQAIRFRTVSNADLSLIDSAQFEKFIAFLAKTYPLVHAQLHLERVNSYALLYSWKGKNPKLKPAMLMGHYDVVPVIQGTERLWKHKPFAGEIAAGFVYGRGTLDDKETVIGVLEAVEHLLREGFQPERSFYLAFGHDEEVSGLNGAKKVAALLKSRKVELEFVIDEGGSIQLDAIPGLNHPVALVGVAEKGYTTLTLTSSSEGGHSSMPPPRTSIGELATALDRLQKHPFPARLEGAVGYMQDYIGPELPFSGRMAMANRWLLKSAIIGMLAKSNAGNASVRTTIAPTILQAGVKDNVLPIEAMAKVNFRILPGDKVEDVITHAKKAIQNERISVTSNQAADTNPSPISDTATLGFRLIHRSIKNCFPEVLVTPYLVIGATDARHYTQVCSSVYRFAPVRLNTEDLKRPHGTNERISVEDFKNVVRFYVELIRGS